MNTPFSPLAVVGIGCLFPKAGGPGAYWANVKTGVDAITDVPPTHWNPADYFDPDPKKPDRTYARRGGFLDVVDFNPLEFGIPPKDIEATDTSQLLGLVAAKQALTDAGVDFNKTDRSRVSVILGVTGTLELVIPLGARLGHPHWKRALKDAGVPDDQAADVIDRIGDAYVPWQENSFPGLLGNVVAGRIANKLDLHGTNCVVDAACASSLSAVHLAALELQTGKADVVVTGGADTFNDIFMYMCFSKTPALSPTGDSKPFDAAGDGTILGEGIGIVVLKRLADAERDGDRIYAVLKGLGTSSDGKGNAIYAPSAEGQKRCLLDAYSRAGVNPRTVELVEAHGTGTKVGDAVEASALTEVFGQSTPLSERAVPHPPHPEGAEYTRPRTAIGSVKSMIGHTKAAAGAASLIKAALALYNKVLPPTLKVTAPVEPLAADTPFYVNTRMRPWLPQADHPRRAGVSAFGFGGSNFHAVLEEYGAAKAAPDWDGSVEILALSGDSVTRVADSLRESVPKPALGESGPPYWADFARAAEASRGTFDPSAPYRLVLVAHRTLTDLPKLLAAAAAKLAAEPDADGWSLPEGVYFGRGAAAGTLAVLFPGQGSQRVDMLRDLACTFPEFLSTLAAANAEPGDGIRLTDRIYPPTSFAPDAKATQDEALRRTDVTQPALGAVSYGAFKVLRDRFGVTATTFGGHSYGELPALTAGGRIGEADLHLLSRLRGRLMAAGPKGGDPGAMLAVIGPLPAVERVVKQSGTRVVIANKNSPTQTVLSGLTADVEAVDKALGDAGLKGVRLPVAAAFHSERVADAVKPFREALNAVDVRPGTAPVYANVTAAVYPADPAQVRDLLGCQLANTVEFVEQIRAMVRAGVRTFLEVGPGGVLTRLVDAILAETSAAGRGLAFPLDASGGGKPGLLDLAHALARLAARGHPVNLAEWEKGSTCRPPAKPARQSMTVPICGANSVTPRAKRPPRPTPAGRTTAQPQTTAGIRRMTDHPELAQALSATQQTLAALQQLQETTARLHRQFLEQQEQAQKTLLALVQQQQAVFGPPVAVPVAAVAPQPVPVPPPPPPRVAPPPPPPPVVAPPPQPAAAAPVSSGRAAEVGRVLLGVVAEKTGYPEGMLSLGMALDADLGVDSIKRVEILSALQDRLPDAPAVRPEHLARLHTLQDVADFLAGPAEHTPGTNGVAAHPPEPEEADTVRAAVIAQSRPTPDELDSILITPRARPPADTPPPKAGDQKAEVGRVLLGVVAEKTGYPEGMLSLGMALDADLGVDSIKRVEILSALQDRLPDAPAVRPEHLARLHTLQDVADFLAAGSPPASRLSELSGPKTEQVDTIRLASMPDPVAPPPPAPVPPPAPNTSWAPPPEVIDRSILQVVDINLAAPRPRVPLAEGSEVWVVADPADPFAHALTAQLTELRFKLKGWGWVDPAAAAAGSPAAVVLVAPPAAPADLNRLAFRWLQHAGAKLRAAARTGTGLFATVGRLDGAFGLGDLAADADPTAGGLAGLVKTVSHEWPEVTAKAVDLAPAFAAADPRKAAAAVTEELLTAGPVEVGVSATHRVGLEPARTVRKASGSGGVTVFGPGDVILVTGGGRGVTAEAAVALAGVFRPTLILTGRTPAPTGPEPAWAAGVTDEALLRSAAAERMGPGATPKAVGEAVQRLLAHREITATLARIEQAGGKAAYLPADVTDPAAVADLLRQVLAAHGPITGLIHGAGVLADRRIEELTAEQFDGVYHTKVTAARGLLDRLAGQPLKAVMLFSSTTARFGRTGQLAYAAANEVLNKLAQREARRRPDARVAAINWGPWEGGMVTPALRRVFEGEGVGLIPLADGGAFLVQELAATGRAVEVIALAKPRNKGGSAALPAAAVRRTGSGAIPASPPPAGPPSTNPPVPELTPVFERAVDLATHPVLRSHVIDGRAVLPLALHMEWLAHAALHGNPGLVFHGFNDVRVTNGVMVEDGGGAAVRALAGRAVKKDGQFLVPVELRGKRRDGRDVIHSRGEVVLAPALPKPPAPAPPPAVQAYPHPLDEIYRYFLFHGPDLHGIERLDGVAEAAFVGSAYPAPAPHEWLENPLRGAWVADPLVLDAAFQMMILWSYAQHGAGSLPCYAGRYRQFRRTFPAGPVRVAVRVTRDNGSFARADVEFTDPADGGVVAQIQDYECVVDPQLNQAFRRNRLAPRVKV